MSATERDVKNGCCSCTHYKLPMSKAPCKGCKRWSNWEDAAGASQQAKNEEAVAPYPLGGPQAVK